MQNYKKNTVGKLLISIGIVIAYMLDNRSQSSSPGGFQNFHFPVLSRPARGPPNLLSSGYWGLFPQG
jgi:hypothetical protein